MASRMRLPTWYRTPMRSMSAVCHILFQLRAAAVAGWVEGAKLFEFRYLVLAISLINNLHSLQQLNRSNDCQNNSPYQ
ncbi:MAG: hypothetical protein U5Q03_17430 [Bacteroidota bacterium]|nr:hypothetical protein [Bacteroidota bacterium]